MSTSESSEKIPVLLASTERRECHQREQGRLFEKHAPNLVVKVIPSTLWNIMQALSGVEEGTDDRESEVLHVTVPKYRALVLGTDCIDETGMMGPGAYIPRESDHPLHEFAPLLNIDGHSEPEADYLKRKKAALELLVKKIREKHPRALLFWLRESSAAQWSQKMQPEHTVLESWGKGEKDEYKTPVQWMRMVSERIAAGEGK